MQATLNEILSIYNKIWPVTTGYGLIRLGSAFDGGYLMPDCLQGIDVCLSPGTCNDTALEEDLARIYGIPSLLCDPGHDAPPEMNSLLKFDRLKLGPESKAEDSISMNDWLRKHGHDQAHSLLLSMDIEGGEYEVIMSLKPEDFMRIRVFCVELHFLHSLFNESRFRAIFNSCLAKMLHYFDVVHMKPNNHVPFQIGNNVLHSCIELTLLNKAMRRHDPIPAHPNELPRLLDSKNNPDKPWPCYEFYSNSRFKPELIVF